MQTKRKAQTFSPEYLAQLRHSCAHVLAQAVQELYPGAKIAIGPAIENGFYYDFDSEHRFTEEDLAAIEKRMRQIAEGNHVFKRQELSPSDSKAYWQGRGETYKLDILKGLEGDAVSHYTHDTFTDLCKGNHLESTQPIRHFKLTHVSGAYWRGIETNPMLQRIYGTAWASEKELKEHLQRMEEARRRDHRKLGPELGYYSIHEEVGGGLILWHPKGTSVRRQIEEYLRGLLEPEGYDFVATPHIASERLYEISGHLENFAEVMYGPIEVEGQRFRAKPMNCPGHIMIYKTGLRSYRELPVRLAEFGTVYRFERSGVLHGLLRVRGFTQDDAHHFCTREQASEEVRTLLRLAARVYKDFGFEEVSYFLSTRPERRVGEDADWDLAEGALRSALTELGLEHEVEAGGGAFYGPKIDIKVRDAIGRDWQLGTVQFDFNLPKRFKAVYRASTGKDEQVVMVHRALVGSFERFFGILIEHYAGRFPLWLAPVQVKLLTLTDEQLPWARELEAELRKAGLRVECDLRPEKVGAKIREATLQKVPYMAVLGPKEAEARTLSLRLPSGRNVAGLTAEAAAAKLAAEVREKKLTSIFEEV